MKAADWPRDPPDEDRLLVIDPVSGRFDDARVRDLSRLLREGDLLVVNDAATLPASLHARTQSGQAVELRLIGHADDDTWQALVFGEGDWRTRTEDRAPPPTLKAGDVVEIAADLRALLLEVEDARLLRIRFDCAGAALWQRLYTHGRPIQYAHVRAPLSLWHVQTRFASRPWAFEMPSAGRPLSFDLLDRLLRAGVQIARITHAAGISSTGSDDLDRRLPLPERSEVPPETLDAIHATRAAGGRVIAVGTTVVRALESRAAQGELRAGPALATLRIGPGFSPRVCDALLTGMHPPPSSHFAVLEAFAPRSLLERALQHATHAGYHEHELGDSCIVLS